MSQTLINTLRFADRLKESGFAGAQAEALARVLGDELTEQLPSKADFQTLQADFKTLEAKFDALEATVESLRSTLNIVLVLVGLLVALGPVEPVSKLFGS
ncbi:MAG: hypothetical protein OXC18_07670 [Desulfurellaceae bacterium]|nr:hypothetical protein [Desulfurellaceae bacterium]